MNELDKNYSDLAREKLFKRLHDCSPQHDVSVNFEKSEILKAFDYSGNILRANSDDQHLHLMAEAVFETCIRLTRCLFYPPEARIIVLRGKHYSISAEQQLELMRSNLKELEKYRS